MKKRHSVLWVALIAFAMIVLNLNGAVAQKKQGGVIRLETTTIEGRVQKPNAFFINTRQGLVYEAITIKESFVSEITESVESGKF